MCLCIVGPSVPASLAAFAGVYFLVFGAGAWYMFRLFGQAPQPHESGPPQGKPIRTAGITPAPSMQRGSDAGPQPVPAE